MSKYFIKNVIVTYVLANKIIILNMIIYNVKGDDAMPFIDSKISVKVSDEKKEIIKSKLGEAASIIGKPESFVMIGFDDDYVLYFGGKKMEKAVYVSVDVYGSSNSSACDKMTEKICEIYEEELGIPSRNIYVEYRSTTDWGWDGRNF